VKIECGGTIKLCFNYFLNVFTSAFFPAQLASSGMKTQPSVAATDFFLDISDLISDFLPHKVLRDILVCATVNMQKWLKTNALITKSS